MFGRVSGKKAKRNREIRRRRIQFMEQGFENWSEGRNEQEI